MSQDFAGKDKDVKTRKNHICDMCGGPIPAHWKAHYYSGVYEGDFGAGWIHPQCWDVFHESGETEWSCGDMSWPEHIKNWWKDHEQEWNEQRKKVKAA